MCDIKLLLCSLSLENLIKSGLTLMKLIRAKCGRKNKIIIIIIFGCQIEFENVVLIDQKTKFFDDIIS